MLRKLRESLDKREEGFTLIELLVVVIIIGILAAIAIPVFLNQREKAWDSAAKSDLRNAAVIQEGIFTETGAYAVDQAGLEFQGFNVSDNIVFSVVSAGTSPTGYCMSASHTSSATVWTYDSADGKPKNTACVNTY
ncbi:MAG: prepilin-type N-terminal cleavage/methylation domain-containing protein [Actinobacteria bacterium]|nr:prepilin-type N-terminal cleavage/methylation domain-containing protein [Actinomycetota bacterium]